MGIRCDPELCANTPAPRAPPMARPSSRPNAKALSPIVDLKWQFPTEKESASDTHSDIAVTLKASIPSPPRSPGDVSFPTPRRMSFFDVGGLLEDGMSHHSASPTAPTFGNSVPPSMYDPSRRGSRALITDMGGYLSPSGPRSPRRDDQISVSSARGSPLASVEELPRSLSEKVEKSTEITSESQHQGPQSLQDVGGLLGSGSPKR